MSLLIERGKNPKGGCLGCFGGDVLWEHGRVGSMSWETPQTDQCFIFVFSLC